MRTWNVHTWAEVDAALRARPRWRRIGREWHGPCPVLGIGENTCWFAEGDSTPVRGGCRKCGGRLLGSAFREHLDAICGQVSTPTPTSTSRWLSPSGAVRPPSTAPGDVWSAGQDPAGTPAQAYLVEQRRVWAPDEPLPPSVRWLSRQSAAGLAVRVPVGAAGILLYRFAAPGETATRAVQYEAVDADGERVLMQGGGKRRSVKGSDFGGGERLFTAAASMPTVSWNICEGPMDALAVASLPGLGWSSLQDAEVVGSSGTGTLALATPPEGRLAVAWCQGDTPGHQAVLQLRARWRCRVEIASEGMDWAEVAASERAEREAMTGGE